jgi:hypothetical protein
LGDNLKKESLSPQLSAKLGQKTFNELSEFLGEEIEDFADEIGVDDIKEIIDSIGVSGIKELVAKFGSIDDKKAEMLAPSEMACGLAITQSLLEGLPAKVIHDEMHYIEKEWKSKKPLSQIVSALKAKYKLPEDAEEVLES